MFLPVEDLLSRHSGSRPLDRIIGHSFSNFVVFRSQLHIFCSVWSLNLNYFLRWSLLVFLLGWNPSLCIARARWLDPSLWWLLCSLSSTSSSCLPVRLTTVYLAVPETLECRVFPVVVTFGLLEQELPFTSSRSHAHPRCFFEEAKLRTPTMMQTCSWIRCYLSTSLFLPRVTFVFRSVVADL